MEQLVFDMAEALDRLEFVGGLHVVDATLKGYATQFKSLPEVAKAVVGYQQAVRNIREHVDFVM
jgi:pyridoxal/pyridoxine/pyridoxamine kinase